MDTTRAIVVIEGGKAAAVREVPIPQIRDEWVLVKVKTVALNPSDWKHIDYGAADAGSKIGFDYAGVVQDVGSKVVKFRKGDRIAGATHGGKRTDHDVGAFGEYIIAKAAVQIHIPSFLSDEEAATLGAGIATVGLGLYKSLGLPLPDAPAKEPFPVLIHAASTASGILGVQYAKASGLTVIATASPHNFDYLRSLGADAVFDYKSPTCAFEIREYVKNKLRFAWDCMGTGAAICAEVMSDSEPGVYGTISPVSPEDEKALKDCRPNVDGPRSILGYDAFGETYTFMGQTIPANPESFQFCVKFYELSERLLAEGVIKPIKPTVNKGGSGLQAALKGLDELRGGKVSGTKLVYTL
ncbi:putative secondary metabolism biosynthetic enzyme [Diatrype stigma]|uniref:Secondary metabolism biosynthetic enzyme n=1 Tax=Diatrype stigma TaxID=117547 RepID=A0AAN9YPW2_9PEZI